MPVASSVAPAIGDARRLERLLDRAEQRGVDLGLDVDETWTAGTSGKKLGIV